MSLFSLNNQETHMIIDSKSATHSGFRNGSLLAAVASLLDSINHDASVEVEAVFDATGKEVSIEIIRAAINKVSKRKGSTFTTRATDNGIRIWRIS